MLLLHQTGSVKIGEVVRYTVTYKPSADHILPSPEFLYLRIKNTSAIALRAAFVHGPYTLSTAAYPSTFRPFEKFENPRRYGVPEFEPMLKAGAVWNCHLIIPDNVRQTAGEGSSEHGHFGSGPGHDEDTVSWVIDVASQVIFSTSASVHYELLLARDEKSLNLGSAIPVIGGPAQASQPGRVSDFQQSAGASKDHPAQPKGVFSKAIHVKVEDTAALWNTPELPGWDNLGWLRAKEDEGGDAPVEPVLESGRPEEPKQQSRQKRKPKKVHLVVLTHGLHSNLGADLLFLKESIDAAVKQARVDAKARKARERAARGRPNPEGAAPVDGSEGDAPEPGQTPGMEEGGQGDTQQQEGEYDIEDDDDEEVIVRGFPGNATKTERGIKYLGKRLARHILSMTYPDQPCLPTAKAASDAIAHTLKASAQKKSAGDEAHKHSTVHQVPSPKINRLYKFTKISFIGHSLGGLVQTYAVAYIQKHSPQFFDLIEPVNFIALASPFLGLNHENPLYVKFALDFGLVGRTGQDLGLTWRAPTIARNGWGALVSNLGEQAHKKVYGETQPESKPLLRILPTGPAHKALKKFRNRTVYSNVVNDGIVPLRTSCLLFLDWQGLGRVEKARREAGLVETVVGFGWAELTGATVTTPRLVPWSPVEPEDKDETASTGKTTPTNSEDSHQVPQPPTNAVLEDDRQSLRSMASPYREPGASELENLQNASTTTSNPFTSFFNLFRSETPKPPPPVSPKISKIYRRSQTLKSGDWSAPESTTSSKSKVTSGSELAEEPESMSAPPRTTIFESAGDLLNPKLPSVEFLINPSKRPRTIFHDRVYHPSDIPPPPLKQRSSGLSLRRRTPTATSSPKPVQSPPSSPPPSHAFEHKDTSLSQQSNRSISSAVGGDRSTVHTTLSSSTANAKDTSRPPTSDLPTTAPATDNNPNPNHSTNNQTDPTPPPPLLPPRPNNPDDEPDIDIDTSQMRVEEKIARAYHRGLSWRKVLVKLEPDAHNNIIVRRTFANAFGWPVVQHLVEAHFSDSATARRRDEDEVAGRERARGLGEGVDWRGRETKGDGELEEDGGVGGGGEGGEGGEGKGKGKGKGVDKEHEGTGEMDGVGEEADTVPDLPSPRSEASSSRGGGANGLGLFVTGPPPALPTTPRPPLDRLDSVTWSDRDWADSGDESDDGAGSGSGSGRGGKKEAGSAAAAAAGGKKAGGGVTGGLSLPFGGGERSGSPLSWNWTEKIVGKVAASRSKSPANSGGGEK